MSRSKSTGLISLFALTGCLFLNGCSSIEPPSDESNLQQVANYYYQLGSSENIPNANRYDFIAEKSKALTTFEQWNKSDDGVATHNTKSVSILGPQDHSGQTYEVVSITEVAPNKAGKKQKRIYSNTWVLESGKWRRLVFPNVQEDYEKAFQSKDYLTAINKAKEWIDLDPYSIEADESLGFAILALLEANRAATAAISTPTPVPPKFVRIITMPDGKAETVYANNGNAGNDGATEYFQAQAAVWDSYNNLSVPHLDEIVKNMISINPDDSALLFWAVNWAPSSDIRKNYFLKLKQSTTDPDEVFALASEIQDMDFRLQFLNGVKETPGILLLKLDAIAVGTVGGGANYRWDFFNDFKASQGAFGKIKPALDGMDSSDSAHWAGRLGLILLQAKDREYAQKLLDYGKDRDPNDFQVKTLAENMANSNK